MKISQIIAASLLISSVFSVQAGPVALVEDVDADSVSVQLLDFVNSGDILELGDNGKITLGYLGNCLREEITGGKVIVGDSESQVIDGQVERIDGKCDSGGLKLSVDEAMHSGAVAVRAIGDSLESSLTVYDTSPILLLKNQTGKVVLKRIDSQGERYKFMVEEDSSDRIKMDLAEKEISLAPGGQYMLSHGGKYIVFNVSDDASHDDKAVLSRLIPL